jgi:hypothetical protein
MEDGLEPVRFEQPLKGSPVADVALDRDQPLVTKLHVLQVDHHAGVIFVQQPTGENRAEETRAASNEDRGIMYGSYESQPNC